MYNLQVGKIKHHVPWFKQGLFTIQRQATTANLVGLVGALLAFFCLLGIHDPQFLNFRLPLYLIVVVWVIVRPRIALYLLPFAIPWGSLDNTGGLSPKGYDADILIALLTASWLMSFALRPLAATWFTKNGPLDRTNYPVPLYLQISIVLLLLAMLISTTMSISLSDSFKQLVKWFEVLVLLLLATQYIHTRRQIWLIVAMICLAAVSQAFQGYVQEFFNQGPASFVRSDSLRVFGEFGQPNPFAGYINSTLAITLALMLLARNWAISLLAALSTVLLALAEYYTQSKGGWLAIAVSLLFIVVVGFPRLRPLFWLGAIALLAAIAAYILGIVPQQLYYPILQKIGLVDISFTNPTTDNYANSERVAHWVAGIRMFLDHPFFGVGIGNYAYSYPKNGIGIFVLPLGHAHNYYINIAAETGIFGLLAFLFFLTAVFVIGGRTIHHLNTRCLEAKVDISHPQVGILDRASKNNLRRFSILVKDRALAIGLLAALVSVCVHNLVDNLYVHSATSLFALLIVLLIRLDGTT